MECWEEGIIDTSWFHFFLRVVARRSLVENRQSRVMSLVVEESTHHGKRNTQIDADDDIVTETTIANPVVIHERIFFGIVSITYR